MTDTKASKPDHQCLFDIASEQKGFFTLSQATGCGFSRRMLTYHTERGRFQREGIGVYRLRDYPQSMFEEVMVAWLAVGRDISVASHQTALELLDLSDVIADRIHLTVSREHRGGTTLPGVRVHTTTRPFGPRDLATREGIRVTSPIRTVMDVDEIGLSLEHVEAAAREAIQRGQATPAMFRERAATYGGRFRRHLAEGLVRL